MGYDDRQLGAYLERIGCERPVHADRATLERVHRAHRLSISFENLGIPLRRGIALDPDLLFDKLVTRRRGGYCFEQNALSLAMAEAIGFKLALFGITLLSVQIRAMRDALATMREGGHPGWDRLTDFGELYETVGFDDYYALEKRYAAE